jgi:hypothetical protein
MREILYIIDAPLCARDFQRFGIEYFEAKGYSVKILDVSPVLYPSAQQFCPPDLMTHPNLITIRSMPEIISFFQQLDHAVRIMCLFGYTYQSLFIIRSIPDRVSYFLFYLNPIPSACREKVKIIQYFGKNLDQIAGILAKRICSQILKIDFFMRKDQFHYPDYAFFSALANSKIRIPFPDFPEQQRVFVHALDYDSFLEKPSAVPLEGPDQTADKEFSLEKSLESDDRETGPIIFIDQCGPFDMDQHYFKIPIFLTAEEYYPALNRFFDLAERRLNRQVIIAAHPRSNDKNNQEFFGERICMRGRTIDLVRKASLVLTHGSTAINYAVLYKKPVMFITTTQWEQTYPGHTCGYARALGKKVYNLNIHNTFPFDTEMTVDSQIYDTYRSQYIKVEHTPEIPFWKVVEEYLDT